MRGLPGWFRNFCVFVCTCHLRFEHGQVAFVACPGFVVRSRRVCLGCVGPGLAQQGTDSQGCQAEATAPWLSPNQRSGCFFHGQIVEPKKAFDGHGSKPMFFTMNCATWLCGWVSYISEPSVKPERETLGRNVPSWAETKPT